MVVRIALVGYGNLGWHLYQRLSFSFPIDVFTRKEQQISPEHSSYALKKGVEKYDLVLIAVGDAAIGETFPYISKNNGLVCHTSGTADINILSPFKNRGVFYPLQTFSKDDKVDWLEIPIFIESNKQENLDDLSYLAERLSNHVEIASSEKRKMIHLSAVMGANFSYMVSFAALNFAREHQIDDKVFMPLFKKNLDKLFDYFPENKITGPAKRRDENTLKSHLELLKDKPELKDVYQKLTEYIQNEL